MNDAHLDLLASQPNWLEVQARVFEEMQSLPEFQNDVLAETKSFEFALAEATLEGFRIQARNYLDLVSNEETLRAYLVIIKRIAKVQVDRVGFRVRPIPEPDGMPEKVWTALKSSDPNVGFEKHDPLKGEIVHVESGLHGLLLEWQGKGYRRAADWVKSSNSLASGAGHRTADQCTSTDLTGSDKQPPTILDPPATSVEEQQPVRGTNPPREFQEKPFPRLNPQQVHIINVSRGMARAKLSDDLQVCWSKCFTFTEGSPNRSTAVEPRRFFLPFVAYSVSIYEGIAEALLVENPEFRTYENWLNYAAKSEVCEREQLAPLWPAQYKSNDKHHPHVDQDQIPAGVWEEAMASSWRIFSDHPPLDWERQSWDLVRALRDPVHPYRTSFLTAIHKAISARTPHLVARGIEVLGTQRPDDGQTDTKRSTIANEQKTDLSESSLGDGRDSAGGRMPPVDREPSSKSIGDEKRPEDHRPFELPLWLTTELPHKQDDRTAPDKGSLDRPSQTDPIWEVPAIQEQPISVTRLSGKVEWINSDVQNADEAVLPLEDEQRITEVVLSGRSELRSEIERLFSGPDWPLAGTLIEPFRRFGVKIFDANAAAYRKAPFKETRSLNDVLSAMVRNLLADLLGAEWESSPGEKVTRISWHSGSDGWRGREIVVLAGNDPDKNCLYHQIVGDAVMYRYRFHAVIPAPDPGEPPGINSSNLEWWRYIGLNERHNLAMAIKPYIEDRVAHWQSIYSSASSKNIDTASKVATEFDRTESGAGAGQTFPEVALPEPKRRGRPVKIDAATKEAALAAKARGGTGKEVAKILYKNPYPSHQQVKNAPNILNHYLKALNPSKKTS